MGARGSDRELNRAMYKWILDSDSTQRAASEARLNSARLSGLSPGGAGNPNRRRRFATLATVRIFRKEFAGFWCGQFDGVYAWSATINVARRGI